ncbi:cyclic nucleotide-binding domain-containing protein [Rhodoferax sp.]|uniref:cyclic nucleotide-binding domain-containing protein n=1 Tax=Rhodoferax sp. TaxID=50421 RepID=UPI0027740081|nr:mechanosensitive ion channel [Rhodoferax sp.]
MSTALLAMIGHRLAMVVLVAALLGVLLRVFKPGLRRELRVTWVLLIVTLMAQGAAVLAQWQGNPSLAAIMEGGATVMAVLALIQLAVLVFFHVLLPVFGVTAPRIAQDLTVTGLSIAWGLVWLSLSGVDPTQLFTTSAIITAVLAFAMQDTLGNVLGGVALQLDNSLKVGEWVRIDELSGRVVDVRWRYTAIETRNRETIVVPNSWLMKNRFGVLRRRLDEPLVWRRTVNFNVDSQAAPTNVIRALQHSVADAQIEFVATDPPPSAVLVDLGAGYFRYALRYWLTDPQFDDPTDSLVRIHALAALTRAGVSLGVPQEERLMVKENDNWRQANEKREMERRLQAVQRTSLFAELPPDEQLTLAQHLVHAPFVRGDTLTRQGAVAHWLYLIVQGEAEVMVDNGGARTRITTLHDGDFFGEMGMLTGEPRSATVIASSDVDCYRLDKVGFAKVLLARPSMAEEISAVLAQRRQELDSLVKQAAQVSPRSHADEVLARIKSFFGVGS